MTLGQALQRVLDFRDNSKAAKSASGQHLEIQPVEDLAGSNCGIGVGGILAAMITHRRTAGDHDVESDGDFHLVRGREGQQPRQFVPAIGIG